MSSIVIRDSRLAQLELKDAMQNLEIRLSETILGIGEVANQVNTGVEQLAQSAQQLAEGANENAEETLKAEAGLR